LEVACGRLGPVEPSDTGGVGVLVVSSVFGVGG
jgi:hypothetical protein